MLRLCIRQFCNSNTNLSGLSSSSKGFFNESLFGLLEPYIPFTFTAITQIGRTIDEDLMEQVGAAGGLRSVLDNCPEKFSVSKIGSVYVARRHRQGGRVQPVQQKQVELHSLQRIKTVHIHKGKIPPSAVFKQFPTFFVPLSAIERLDHKNNDTTKTESNNITGESLSRCIKENEEFLQVVTLGGETFVRLIPGLAAPAEAFERLQENESGPESLISRRLESYEVPPYEHYRVARLIPTSERFVPISSEMREVASPLIAEDRDLLHVFVSEPQLFEVRDNPHLEVRFLLNPNFRPPVGKSTDDIKRELDMMEKCAVKSNGVRVPIDRKKKRSLRNQLQYLVNPLPYFDHTVMAHAILDLLPPDGPVAASRVLSLLPDHARHCVPPNLSSFLRGHSYLFKAFDGGTELFIQRADLPVPEQRPVSSVTSEEILLSIFNAYPRRRHPNLGTCLARCQERLPKLVRDRLREIDFVEGVLQRHPDKVEVLDIQDEIIHKAENKSSPTHYQCFRFIGEWQESLVKNYETLCAKHRCDPNTTLDLMSK